MGKLIDNLIQSMIMGAIFVLVFRSIEYIIGDALCLTKKLFIVGVIVHMSYVCDEKFMNFIR